MENLLKGEGRRPRHQGGVGEAVQPAARQTGGEGMHCGGKKEHWNNARDAFGVRRLLGGES